MRTKKEQHRRRWQDLGMVRWSPLLGLRYGSDQVGVKLHGTQRPYTLRMPSACQPRPARTTLSITAVKKGKGRGGERVPCLACLASASCWHAARTTTPLVCLSLCVCSMEHERKSGRGYAGTWLTPCLMPIAARSYPAYPMRTVDAARMTDKMATAHGWGFMQCWGFMHRCCLSHAPSPKVPSPKVPPGYTRYTRTL
jgi:hypothetical protein